VASVVARFQFSKHQQMMHVKVTGGTGRWVANLMLVFAPLNFRMSVEAVGVAQ
jgi:hypothetical protein